MMMMVEEAMSLNKFFCLGEDSWSTSRDVILVFIFTFFNSYLWILIILIHTLCKRNILKLFNKDVFIFPNDVMHLYIGLCKPGCSTRWVRMKGKKPCHLSQATLKFILLMSTFFYLLKTVIIHKRSIVFLAPINNLFRIP